MSLRKLILRKIDDELGRALQETMDRIRELEQRKREIWQKFMEYLMVGGLIDKILGEIEAGGAPTDEDKAIASAALRLVNDFYLRDITKPLDYDEFTARVNELVRQGWDEERAKVYVRLSELRDARINLLANEAMILMDENKWQAIKLFVTRVGRALAKKGKSENGDTKA